MADTVSQLYPGLLALAGDRRACAWPGPGTTGIAEPPLGRAARAVRRRSRSTISWSGAGSLGLALVLAAACPRRSRLVGANLLLVWVALYAARGAGGVRRPVAGRVPAPVAGGAGAVAMLLLPFVVGGLTLLGLADTWLDFRRRLDAGHRRI